jgi:hypothetical protein
MDEGRVRRPAVATPDRRPLTCPMHQPEAWSGTVIAAITIGGVSDGSATGVSAARWYATGRSGVNGSRTIQLPSATGPVAL